MKTVFIEPDGLNCISQLQPSPFAQEYILKSIADKLAEALEICLEELSKLAPITVPISEWEDRGRPALHEYKEING